VRECERAAGYAVKKLTILEILSLKQEKGEAVINKLSTRPFIVLMM
jgi:hypothetical protein